MFLGPDAFKIIGKLSDSGELVISTYSAKFKLQGENMIEDAEANAAIASAVPLA